MDRDQDDIALGAIQEIIAALNSMASTQQALCEVANDLVVEMRAHNKLVRASQKKSPSRGS